VFHRIREAIKAIACPDDEGSFSELKRSIDGTHHHVSKPHLHRYVGEFDYRYSTRKLTDEERMEDLMSRTTGKRVTHRGLKANSPNPTP